jgi:hypothetical protein
VYPSLIGIILRGRSGDRPSLIKSGTGSDLLDQPGPVFPVFLRTFISCQDAGDPVFFGFFPLNEGTEVLMNRSRGIIWGQRDL